MEASLSRASQPYASQTAGSDTRPVPTTLDGACKTSSSGPSEPAAATATSPPNKIFTEDEERQLARTTDKHERRKIQNRAAQRAWRQRQRTRHKEFKEYIESRPLGTNPLAPNFDIEAIREAFLQNPDPWSDLISSDMHPISATLGDSMQESRENTATNTPRSQPPTTAPSLVGSAPLDPFSRPDSPSPLSTGPFLPNWQPQSLYSIGYIPSSLPHPLITDPPHPRPLDFPLPIRTAVQVNLGLLGIQLPQYLSNDTISPFTTGQFLDPAGNLLPVPQMMTRLSDAAPNLLPTKLQSEIEHHPWVDVIPSAIIRDRILAKLNDENQDIDEVQLCRDIESGVKVWGKIPWDERCWEWKEGFVRKWVWIFDKQALEGTNFWRAFREETRIAVDDDQGRQGVDMEMMGM
ncbi:Similar to hypothetical protein CH063_04312 [Colletotrichum higginsianum]; acc. no. CCF47862 [Pyronema omphalodes CBS 100304]|uniref:BZIP domain-containing protein n=1 Tax=Pyronema omphalodes (strain CBS 100304) TaxID=1076935 RepID=U4L5Q6_PYROM|nr:Similar to hypothetical protein CH063_04312 [Colletotrichum higginsianum]; acc. no. CCF47862 [Pyronema omphalodes CBS 100304]